MPILQMGNEAHGDEVTYPRSYKKALTQLGTVSRSHEPKPNARYLLFLLGEFHRIPFHFGTGAIFPLHYACLTYYCIAVTHPLYFLLHQHFPVIALVVHIIW